MAFPHFLLVYLSIGILFTLIMRSGSVVHYDQMVRELAAEKNTPLARMACVVVACCVLLWWVILGAMFFTRDD